MDLGKLEKRIGTFKEGETKMTLEEYVDATGTEPLSTEDSLEELVSYLEILRELYPDIDLGEDFTYILENAAARVQGNREKKRVT